MRYIFLLALALFSLSGNAQIPMLEMIDKPEQFLLENVRDYPAVRTESLEHEPFDILVFEDKDIEVACFFTFYRNEKLCHLVRSRGPSSKMKADVEAIKNTFHARDDKQWENKDKTVLVSITERDGQTTLIARGVR